MDLVQQIMAQLGLGEDQAKGGLGLLLQQAKEKLGATDFGKIKDIIPQADALVGAAPAESGGMIGAIGGLAKAFGAKGLGDAAKMLDGFSKLGIAKEKIAVFVKLVLDYVQEHGGEAFKVLLERVLKTS